MGNLPGLRISSRSLVYIFIVDVHSTYAATVTFPDSDTYDNLPLYKVFVKRYITYSLRTADTSSLGVFVKAILRAFFSKAYEESSIFLTPLQDNINR